MGEPLLAAYLQSLLVKLAPGPLMEFAIQKGFDSELRKWRSMLRKIKLVLADAEEKQMNDIEVKRWLDDLLVLAYDADDALDDIDCETLQQQNNSSSDPATSSSQLLDMLPLIKKITAGFQDIEEQKSDLGLEAKHGVRSSIINKRSETTSLLDTSEIVGREQEVKAILKLMGLSETTEAEAHASPAFGMGGFGSEPHKLLRKLVIRGYCGVTLPNWIGNSSYSKLAELSLINCTRCKSLPSFGQLPLLQKLVIYGMLEIETIGTELYGEASQPFPSLKTLEFECMPKWVNWSLQVGINSLLHLKIKNCPDLVVPVLSMFPSLRELRLTDVKNISNGLHCPTSLAELHIENYKNLRTLPDGIMSSNSNLQVLEIRACESLESFPSGVLPSILKVLSIWNCRKLESISEMLLGPTSLDYVDFDEYPNLKSLPECLCTNLTRLRIERCESIESFPGLPSPNLTVLMIHECKNLKHLPDNLHKLTSLLHLYVTWCNNLVSLPEGGFPPSLQLLAFGDCGKAEQQMWDELAPHKLPSLVHLFIEGGFRNEVCFPFPAQESQSLLPPTLTDLCIAYLSNLESLSSSGFRNLTSLSELRICGCPKLQSLPIEALLPSLLSLWIETCPDLQPKCEEGGEYWARLSLLPRVSIEGQLIS
ncbi:Rx, N-terminal [Dillenia turbinata]|uniref:Rx, N-terminal n=1 Tax=Dillenia turbinata TaxID=194707 RepID=A0AAN8ZBE4_9MAGN